MAHEGADAIVFVRVEGQDAGSHFVQQVDEAGDVSLGEVLPEEGSEEPDGVTKEVGIGEFDATAFFAGHGVSGEKTFRDVSAENVAGAGHDFKLGAADVGDEGVGRDERADALEQIDDGADRGGKDDEIASLYRLFGIGNALVDGAKVAGTHE